MSLIQWAVKDNYYVLLRGSMWTVGLLLVVQALFSHTCSAEELRHIFRAMKHKQECSESLSWRCSA